MSPSTQPAPTTLDNQWLAQDAGSSWLTLTVRTQDDSAEAAKQGYAGISSYTTDVWASSRDGLLCEALAQYDIFQGRV